MINTTCPIAAGSADYTVRGTAWKPMLYASSLCTCVTIIIAFSLIILHLRRYRAPEEQRQIIRIVFSVILYSIVAVFEIYNYEVVEYIDQIGNLYEAFGLCALFLLFVQYAVPNGSYDSDHFTNIKAASEKPRSYDWPRIFWIAVFQFPIVDFFCVVITEVTQALGSYCVTSLEPQFSHIWVELLISVSIFICVLSIVCFRNNMLSRFKVRRSLAKIVCFKIIVFFRFFQAWALSAFLTYGVITTGPIFSYHDIVWGIPGLATCVEMIVFALGFWYAFSSTEYGTKAKPDQNPLPWWKAVVDALNPWDLIFGIARIFTLFRDVHRSRDWKKWRSAQGQNVRDLFAKLRPRKKRGAVDGPYQDLDDNTKALTKPSEAHRERSEAETTCTSDDSYAMDGFGKQEVYQPRPATPPEQLNAHLVPKNPSKPARTLYPGQWNRSNRSTYTTAPSTPTAPTHEEPLKES